MMLKIDETVVCQILDHGDEKFLSFDKANEKYITKAKQKMKLTYNHTDFTIYLTFQAEESDVALYDFYVYNSGDILIKNNYDNASLFIKEVSGWEWVQKNIKFE